MINGVVDSVTSKEVKFNNKSRAFRCVNLDKLLSLSPQLGPAGAGELGGAVRHRLTLQPHAGQDVTLQHLLQLLLVGHQLVQGVHGHLIKSSVGGGKHSEGPGPGQVFHHAGSLESGVEGGEVLILSDHGGNALAGFLDGNWSLGGGAGDGVDVWSAEVMRLRARRTDGEVVVKSSDWPRVVGKNPLRCQEWVEWLDGSALERSPLGSSHGPHGFSYNRDRTGPVVDSFVKAGLYMGRFGVLGVLDMLSVMGAMCGMLGVMTTMSRVCSMCSWLSSMLCMLSMMSVLTRVGVVEISPDHGNHH